MDVFSIQPDGTEDLVASGLRAAEVEELRDWFRYTKPIGRGVKIVARPISACDSAYSVQAAGTEPDLTERERANQWRSQPGTEAQMNDRLAGSGRRAIAKHPRHKTTGV